MFELTVTNDEILDWSGPGVFDVVVKGGKKSTHFDYIAPAAGSNYAGGVAFADTGLHAPTKGRNKLFSVSHVSICYSLGLFGTVWHDHDQDGRQDNGEPNPPGTEPVEGGLEFWTINVSGTATDSTTTDANGNYAFTGLTDGPYTICVTPPSGGPDGQWRQSTPFDDTTDLCGSLPELPDGHDITLAGADVVNFGNYWTVIGACNDTEVFSAFEEHSITFPAAFCFKPDAVYVFETYTLGNGDQVVEFHLAEGEDANGDVFITEVLVWEIDQDQNSSTLNYNDILPFDTANNRVAKYCNHDPTDGSGNLVAGRVPPIMTVLPVGETTCIIESTEGPNAAGDDIRTDFLYSEFDGRRFV